MGDCQHKNQIKLFIIKRFAFDDIPDHAGYSICTDCIDYRITGWVHKADVWATHDVYSMADTIDKEDHDTTPVEMFKRWITDDLRPMGGEEPPQVLSP